MLHPYTIYPKYGIIKNKNHFKLEQKKKGNKNENYHTHLLDKLYFGRDV